MSDTVQIVAPINVPDLDKTGATYLVVLVKADHCASYVAYVGLVRLGLGKGRMEKAGLKVAARGRKLSYEQAHSYFPALKKSEYRT